MAGTVQDTALQILAATASDAGVQLAVNWLNQRYAELISRTRMRQNRRYGSLYMPQPITLPTVSATAGTTSITFSVAPKDPVSGNNVSVQGWQIRTNVTWYWITAHVSGQTTATIETPYSDATGTGLNCTMVKRYLPITDPSARWVSAIVHPRRRKRLRFKPGDQFNEQYPSRPLVGAFPWCWTEAPRFIGALDISPILGSSGQKFVEIYPYSNIAETFGYIYWNVPTSFAVTDSLPPEIDEYVLREGVLIDVYRYKQEQALKDATKVQLGEVYANLVSRQMAVWEKVIQQAMVTDALYHNEVPVEVDMFSDSGEYSGDITTAHDWIMSGWTQ